MVLPNVAKTANQLPSVSGKYGRELSKRQKNPASSSIFCQFSRSSFNCPARNSVSFFPHLRNFRSRKYLALKKLLVLCKITLDRRQKKLSNSALEFPCLNVKQLLKGEFWKKVRTKNDIGFLETFQLLNHGYFASHRYHRNLESYRQAGYVLSLCLGGEKILPSLTRETLLPLLLNGDLYPCLLRLCCHIINPPSPCFPHIR